jgi:hypothetical protein
MFNTNANIEKIRKHNRMHSEGQERRIRDRAKRKLTRRDYERLAEEKEYASYKIAA